MVKKAFTGCSIAMSFVMSASLLLAGDDSTGSSTISADRMGGPPSASTAIMGGAPPACASCEAGQCRESCWSHLCGWLTYRPLERGCCCCQCQCCCSPPLYAWFPCQGCCGNGLCQMAPTSCGSCGGCGKTHRWLPWDWKWWN